MKFIGKLCLLLLFAHAESRFQEQHRPCSFNPLCTCSNGGPDLGSVCCHNIPFMTVPSQINNSAIYIMSLKNNKLRFLEDNSLNGTGLWKLQINNNLLTDLPPNSLAGLEKTLSVLDLSENELVRIPREAVQNLEKLYNLNLAGNHISFFQNDDFRGISKTLKVLDLSENGLIHIPNDAFRNMVSLETLNLAFNAIISIDDIAFQNGLNNLRRINLMGNQLHQIPLNVLANLKNIKSINLNENLISTISEGREIRNRIHLEELHLENNLIKELTPDSFRLFDDVSRLYLKGNPLEIINDTFSNVNVTEIYMPHCAISEISKNAFSGVTNTLKVLDLSYNNLKEYPNLPLRKLIKLSLAGNELSAIEHDDIKSFASTLKHLDIRGPKMKGITKDTLKTLTNLRELLFHNQKSSIHPHLLVNISPSMEKLHIVKSSLKSIENGAFQQLSGLKQLDLSYNSIARMGNATFKDIGHSLEKLLLHNSLKMSIFPYKVLNHLSKLQYLDLSGNNLGYLPHESFSLFQNLKFLNLNHNELKNLETSYVSGINNPNLMQLKIAFNKISVLKSRSFRDLQKLIYLQLNDNLIKVIEKSAFSDLDSLISIELEGNLIENIENEAFQNLPNIQFINLGYNKLVTFNLDSFDQVGRLSTLRIDVDHNEIQNLTANHTSSHTSCNIKRINFSHNNISYLDSNYFDPIRLSVNILDLSYNKIPNLTCLAFADMTHLQTLVLSNNEIDTIDEDELKGLRSLQILDLSRNNVEDLPSNLFEEHNKLRVFSMSHNELENLPKYIFATTVLEQLDLSYNRIDEFPEDAILQIKDTLQYLDLTGNQIKSVNFNSMKNLQNLRHFSISQNRLHLPDAAEELHLPKLISLDLSHNHIQDLPDWILSHLPRSLESLNLANTSLKEIPVLDACNILLLNLSSNSIQNVEEETLEQLKKLQILDFSNNLLPNTFNNIWSNLQQLRSLYLQTNPIQSISNNSFSNMERLQELFIKNLKLQDIQKEAFHQLSALRKLEMDTYPKLKNINLSQLISKNFGLREVHLHVQEHELEGVLNGDIPKSLKAITLEGENLKQVDDSAFSSILSQDLNLDIRHTNITKLSRKLFQNMKEVKNFTASFKNNKLQRVERIFTPNEKEVPDKILRQLELSGNQLHCNCELAWIWEWLSEYEHQNGCTEMPCSETFLEDLRETRCANMNNKSIISVFKTDLDCFSSRASSFLFTAPIQFILELTLIFLYMKTFT